MAVTFNTALLIITFLTLSEYKSVRCKASNMTKITGTIKNSSTSKPHSNHKWPEDFSHGLKPEDFNNSKEEDSEDLVLRESQDYQINNEELRATTPPEMDPLAELVDDNGKKLEDERDSNSGKSGKLISKGKSNTKIPYNWENAGISDLTAPVSPPKTLLLGTLGRVNTYLKNKLNKTQELQNNEPNSPKSTHFCLKGPDSGWCEGGGASIQLRYYYHQKSSRCECFLYYGCEGNKNNFENITDCSQQCQRFGLISGETPFDADKCRIIP